jgi:hypothetical protein
MTFTKANLKLVHVLKGKSYEFKTPCTRTRAMSETKKGLIKVKRSKIKTDASSAHFTFNLKTGLRVPMEALIKPLDRDTLKVRARH